MNKYICALLGITFLSFSPVKAYTSTEIKDFKSILIGRQELIQNDLIKYIVDSKNNNTNNDSNELCKSVVKAFAASNSTCESVANHVIKENEELKKENLSLKAQLADLKKKK